MACNRSKAQKKELEEKASTNLCQVLIDFDEEQEEIELEVLKTTFREIKRRDIDINKKKDKLWETHDAERMNVDALESLLMSLNEEHVQSQQESSKKIKGVKHDIAVQNSKVKECKDSIKIQKGKIN